MKNLENVKAFRCKTWHGKNAKKKSKMKIATLECVGADDKKVSRSDFKKVFNDLQ